MKRSRRARRVLIGAGLLAAIVVTAAIALPPVIARQLTLYYLDRAGVDVTLGNVDVNLLEGTLAYDEVAGDGRQGGGFSIGHVQISIDYAPLFAKRLSVSRFNLADAAIDVRRSADNSLRVGGIAIGSSARSTSSAPDWGLALEQVTLKGLRIHYMQPAHGDQPAIDRELIFNESSARDVVSWQADNDVPLAADMRVGDGHIQIAGRITPFGPTVSGHFELETRNFALDLLSPLTGGQGLQRLTGTLDASQQIDIQYAPKQALKIGIDGHADWHTSAMNLASGIALSGERLQWQGTLDFDLLRPDGQPAMLRSDGQLTAKDLALGQSGMFDLTQASGDWQGKAALTLAADATRIDTDGRLAGKQIELSAGKRDRVALPDIDWHGTASTRIGRDGNTRVDAKGALESTHVDVQLAGDTRVDTRGAHWQGALAARVGPTLGLDGDGAFEADTLDLRMAGNSHIQGRGLRWQGKAKTVTDAKTRIDSDGMFKADGLDVDVPDSLALDMAALRWQGAIDVTTGQTTHIHSDGGLDSGALSFAVPQTATFETQSARWQGSLNVDVAGLLSRRASGRLIADGARLALPGQPLAVAADRFVFNGDYSEQPGSTGNELVLRIGGDVASQAFTLDNTRIDAPWAVLRDVEIDNLDIDGLERMGFDTLSAKGVRLLGDTNTSAAVLDATSTTARGFALDKLRDYRLSSLDVDGATIHVRRDAQGMGVMALYFGSSDKAGSAAENPPSATPSSYSIDHLTLSGPLVAFNDVAVTPAVSLRGHALELTADDLDTASPERDVRFQLSLDVGSYGHLDSRGTVAPLATGGMNMDIDAWLRSLALAPLSGYLNAAMQRRIAGGVADGTLKLKANDGQLDGNLDTTLSNFRLADNAGKTTDIVLGISMNTALDMVRRDNDIIRFETAILGDVTNPYFSIRNLVREAVLAGLRTTVMSDYSPVGLINKAKNALLKIGRTTASEPVVFAAGRHFVARDTRSYLAGVAQSMRAKPRLTLTIQGHATPADAKAMAGFGQTARSTVNSLPTLARARGISVRDYLAARDVNPDRLVLAEPTVDRGPDAQPVVTFTLTGQ